MDWRNQKGALGSHQIALSYIWAGETTNKRKKLVVDSQIEC